MSRRDTPYARAVENLLQRVALEVFADAAPSKPVTVLVAGGAAVHHFTGGRVSKLLDAEFLAKLLRPSATVQYRELDGAEHTVQLNVEYTSTLVLMHEGYLNRAAPSGWAANGFEVKVLAPVDLAITNLTWWTDVDRADVRSLIAAGLVNRATFERLANEAIAACVGSVALVRANLSEALDMFPSPCTEPPNH